MNDVPPRPLEPSGPVADRTSETASRAVEGTGASLVPGATAAGDHSGAPRIGEYAVVALIGEGGMGAVYLAEDAQLHRKVAIKTMKPELAANRIARDRFVREARAAAAVEHDNIVPILHVGEAADGTPFIVMPFLQGESLDARLRRESTPDLELVLKVAREVAEGLTAAHAKGLIHRDIKPANVWLEGDPDTALAVQQVRRCKILDFGLARSVDKEDAQITASGAILGTPAFMAPEQARGEKVDHRADLFSLGVMLYRMATGKLPFNGPTPMAVLVALATETPRPVRDLNPSAPPALADLIERLMCKDPAGRPQSAAEVAAAVRALAEQPPGFTPPIARPAEPIGVAAPQPVERGANRNRWPWVFACLLALGAPGVWLACGPGEKKNAGDRGYTQAPPSVPPVVYQIVQPDPVRFEPPKKEEPPAGTPAERKAAEYVISVGGSVRANDSSPDIKEFKNLPKQPFRLTGVELGKGTKVTDAGLSKFKECMHLASLNLSGSAVTDEGLAHFADSTAITTLDLSETAVTDAGLVHFKDCFRLAQLRLQNTKVTDAGLAHFAGCRDLEALGLSLTPVANAGLAHFKDSKKLVALDLNHTAVTDAGLAHFAGCKKLALLHLDDTKITDVGLAHFKDSKEYRHVSLIRVPVTGAGLAIFKDCKHLSHLMLASTRVTDDGLAYLVGCEKLGTIFLDNTPVTDAGLAHLKHLPHLKFLTLTRTKVSAKGVEQLASALPACDIFWDGGLLKPKK